MDRGLRLMYVLLQGRYSITELSIGCVVFGCIVLIELWLKRRKNNG